MTENRIRIRRNSRTETITDGGANDLPAWELYARADAAANRLTQAANLRPLLDVYDEARAEIARLRSMLGAAQRDVATHKQAAAELAARLEVAEPLAQRALCGEPEDGAS